MKKVWREIAGGHRERPHGNRVAQEPICQGERTALMTMALKGADVYDEERRGRREVYGAFVEVRFGTGMLIAANAKSEVSQVDAFEAALQHALSRYDPHLSRAKVWPLRIEIINRNEGVHAGVQATVRVSARIEQDGWSYNGEVEHRDTVKAICLLVFQAYDAHFTEHLRTGFRGVEMITSPGVVGDNDSRRVMPSAG